VSRTLARRRPAHPLRTGGGVRGRPRPAPPPTNNAAGDGREAAGPSGADPSGAVGASGRTVSAVERGRYDPSPGLAFALADHFGCRVEELFDPALDGDG